VTFRKWQKTLDGQKPTVKTFVAGQARCEWCFREKGKTFTNHTETTCNNKKRAEKTKNNPSACWNCGEEGHRNKDCPKPKNGTKTTLALSAVTTQQQVAAAVSEAVAALRQELLQGALTKDNVSVDKKELDQYSVSSCNMPTTSSHLTHKLTLALLSGVARRTRQPAIPSMIDTAATQSITPETSLVKDLKRSDKRIACANDSIMQMNIQEGTLHAGDRCWATMPSLKTLTTPEAAATLISGPELVYKHKQDLVLSSTKGCFMQSSHHDRCPVCHINPDRIAISGSSEGFMVNLHPQPDMPRVYGLSDKSEQHPELDDVRKELFPSATPGVSNSADGAPQSRVGNLPASRMSEAGIGVSTSAGDAMQSEAGTARISEAGIRRFKLVHAIFGGAITAHNVHNFIDMYPAYSESIGHKSLSKTQKCAHYWTNATGAIAPS